MEEKRIFSEFLYSKVEELERFLEESKKKIEE